MIQIRRCCLPPPARCSLQPPRRYRFYRFFFFFMAFRFRLRAFADKGGLDWERFCPGEEIALER